MDECNDDDDDKMAAYLGFEKRLIHTVRANLQAI